MEDLDTMGEDAGYLWLIRHLGLRVPEPRVQHRIGVGSRRSVQSDGPITRRVLPAARAVAPEPGAQLLFALKHDGVDLTVLAAVFKVIDTAVLARVIAEKPYSAGRRRLWFLYEWMTPEAPLPLEDLTNGAYVPVLDPNRYHTPAVGRDQRSRRHRVEVNLLGTRGFCPIVRRTDRLADYAGEEVDQQMRELRDSFDEALFTRAVTYLYQKESRSSFAIEQETATPDRNARFVAELARAEQDDYLNAERLVALQNAIVEPRYQNTGWRETQIYVSHTVNWTDQHFHYIGPKPEDVDALMRGLIDTGHRVLRPGAAVQPLVAAALVAFGFVFIHPFDDGNGRIHRLLIHHVLSRTGFTPPGMVLPVSAVMLEQMGRYDAALEAFSKPLLKHLDYTLDDAHQMTVSGDTADFYRYPDLTFQAEVLGEFIRQAVREELPRELRFLETYDRLREGVREVVDMPNVKLDLMLKLLRQGNGHLSKRKRQGQFAELEDREVAAMERVYAEVMATSEP